MCLSSRRSSSARTPCRSNPPRRTDRRADCRHGNHLEHTLGNHRHLRAIGRPDRTIAYARIDREIRHRQVPLNPLVSRRTACSGSDSSPREKRVEYALSAADCDTVSICRPCRKFPAQIFPLQAPSSSPSRDRRSRYRSAARSRFTSRYAMRLPSGDHAGAIAASAAASRECSAPLFISRTQISIGPPARIRRPREPACPSADHAGFGVEERALRDVHGFPADRHHVDVAECREGDSGFRRAKSQAFTMPSTRRGARESKSRCESACIRRGSTCRVAENSIVRTEAGEGHAWHHPRTNLSVRDIDKFLRRRSSQRETQRTFSSPVISWHHRSRNGSTAPASGDRPSHPSG